MPSRNDLPAGSDLECSVDRDHSIRGAAVLMETDVGAIEIKGAIGLVAGFGIDRQPAGYFPIKSDSGPHFAIREDSVVQSGYPMGATEIVAHPEVCLL
jgi:hypothetical protein